MFRPLKTRCPLWWSLTVLIWLLSMLVVIPVSSENIPKANTSCIERERQALLSFRSGLVDHLNLLSSWRSDDKDCCLWIGVHCRHKTGHVTALYLSRKVLQQSHNKFEAGISLEGEIGPSLLNLTYLSYLDLSFNNFTRLPAFVGSLGRLRYLDLSYSFCLQSRVLLPPELGNLSKLEYLDFGCQYDSRIDTVEWVSRLSSLRNLHMNGLNLSSMPNSFQSITTPPSLVSLTLRFCQISIPPYPSNFNSSKFLQVIDIYAADINPATRFFRWLNGSHKLVDLTVSESISGPEDSILDFVGTMTSLEHLDLSANYLTGQIPMSWGNLFNLITLDLSSSGIGKINGTLNAFQNWTRCPRNNVLREFRARNNELTGPFDFTKFTSLEVLDVSYNLLNGSLSDGIWKLSNLTVFDISYNLFTGNLSDGIWKLSNLTVLDISNNLFTGSLLDGIWKLSNLTVLDISNNLFTGSLSDGIWKLSNLTVLDISNNHFTGILPETVGKLSNLTVLDVGSNFLEGLISDCHFSKLHRLKTLDLSSNSFKLNLSSNWVPPFQLDVLDLSSCKLGPSFPNWIRTQENLVQLCISNSGISDVFPSWFFGISSFWILDLSKNKISGNISLICTQKFGALSFLDLSSNLLSGHLPDCWMDKKDLGILDLSNNDFQETIPSSMGTLRRLISLRLNNNNLSGKLPSSFCSRGLIALGLGGNQLSGKIPTCIGNISSLVVLELQSNRFWGDIPKSICQLEEVQTLDLSLNYLSGAIPTCLSNLTAMAQKETQYIRPILLFEYGPFGEYFANAWVTWKGTKAEYQKTLWLLKLIDLSSNKLSGEIPAELTSLYGLISLNLSSNKLTGIIPDRIGQLSQLEVLDLSNNELSGKIPESMSNISRLDYLNLSNNYLSGSIPSSTQMQSFSPTAFVGNPGLCGLPLATKCSGDGNLYPPPIINHGRADDSNQEDEQRFKSPWFYGSVLLGYAFGFWGVCAPLVLSAPFRQAYFQFLNRVKDSLLLAIALKRAKLKRWLQS